MKYSIDTHTHTLVSGHAYNTIDEMAAYAAGIGVTHLAITDHAPKMPGSAGILYFSNMGIIPRQKCGVKIYMGCEVNMFDYFKKMKQTQHEAEENEPQESKPKKDIVFIIILIMFGAIIAVGLITGINDLAGDTAQDTNLVFRFSVTDGIILGGITVAYIVTHIRKGRK